MSYLSKAIIKLQPTAEFSFQNEDYSTIKWDVLDGDAPTQKEIDAAIKEIKADEITQAATKSAQKQALLDRLGITAEEAQILLA
jgi:hypothetical protein